MSQFSRQTIMTFQQVIIADHPASDPGTDGQIEKIMVPNPTSIFPFSQRGQVGIIPR